MHAKIKIDFRQWMQWYSRERRNNSSIVEQRWIEEGGKAWHDISEKKHTCKRCGHKCEKKEYDGAGDNKSEIKEESGNVFGASEATMKVGNH